MSTVNSVTEYGEFDEKFQETFELFKRNIESDEEVGASFAVYKDGKPIIDLYGGFQDRDKKISWNKDTLVNVHSTSKGIVAMVVAKLIDNGDLELDKRVCDYWPEFSENGKMILR